MFWSDHTKTCIQDSLSIHEKTLIKLPIITTQQYIKRHVYSNVMREYCIRNYDPPWTTVMENTRKYFWTGKTRT